MGRSPSAVKVSPAGRLWLLRHGRAEERDSARLADRDRRLTPAGVKRTTLVSHRLVALGHGGGRGVSSGLRRADETAAIACSAGLLLGWHPDRRLAPGGDLLALLRDWMMCVPVQQDEEGPGQQVGSLLAPAAPLCLVGHEPQLGELLDWLTGSPQGGLRKTGFAVLTLSGPPARGCARLEALFRPRDLL